MEAKKTINDQSKSPKIVHTFFFKAHRKWILVFKYSVIHLNSVGLSILVWLKVISPSSFIASILWDAKFCMLILCGKYPHSICYNGEVVNIFKEASGLIDQFDKTAALVTVVVDFFDDIFGIEYLSMLG